MKLPDALPAPYDAPPRAGGVTPRPETVSLVQSQIDALLSQTPSFYGLSEGDRDAMRRRLTHIGAYAAELVRDSWAQSKRLGQTPLVRKETVYRPAQEPSGGGHHHLGSLVVAHGVGGGGHGRDDPEAVEGQARGGHGLLGGQDLVEGHRVEGPRGVVRPRAGPQPLGHLLEAVAERGIHGVDAAVGEPAVGDQGERRGEHEGRQRLGSAAGPGQALHVPHRVGAHPAGVPMALDQAPAHVGVERLGLHAQPGRRLRGGEAQPAHVGRSMLIIGQD